jgi:glycosyltransferase involved in cell wall biosynthesis
MKIAQIVCVFPPYKGGIGKSAYYFSKLLAERGNLVDVYSPLYESNKFLEEENKFNLKFLKAPLKLGKGAFLPQIFFKLKKYDIVHLHYPFFGTAEIVWLAKLLFKSKFKLVIHYHMDTLSLSKIAFIFSIPSRLIEKNLFKRADALTYASLDYIKNSKIKKIYFKNPNKFYEIPFGVDVKEKNQIDKNLSTLESRKIGKIKKILFVGGLDSAHYFKGLDILFKALQKINLKYFLNIVGSGNLENEYKNLTRKYKIDSFVKFSGNLSDQELKKSYREADLLVLPSINSHEAFGIVLIEAMAEGTPVVASNLPGVRSVFEDGVHGFLSKAGDEESLRNAIQKIFKDEKKYEKMSKASRDLVLKKYDWDIIGERLNNFFNKIIS